MKALIDTFISTLFLIVLVQAIGDRTPALNWHQGVLWLSVISLAWVFYGRASMKIEHALSASVLALGLAYVLQRQGLQGFALGNAIAFSKLAMVGLFTVVFLICQSLKLK